MEHSIIPMLYQNRLSQRHSYLHKLFEQKFLEGYVVSERKYQESASGERTFLDIFQVTNDRIYLSFRNNFQG